MIKIDKNIPYDCSCRRYPWKDMEIGDSFFIGGENRNRINAAIAYANKKFAMKFSSRSRVEEGASGIRVWRIE